MLYMRTFLIYTYEWRTKLYVKLNAIHKLGSSPISCEDFSIPGSIKNGVWVEGRPLSVVKVLCNLGKAKANQRLN